jgi:hippurate hydrolase
MANLHPVVRGLAHSIASIVWIAAVAHGQERRLASEVQAVYAQSEVLYRHFHQNPELSLREAQTAERLSAELRTTGFEVTPGVGKTGVVAVLRNGPGPTVMLRADMDALPLVENTGLAFASKTKTKDDSGAEVGVMHACGHDLHMAALVGAARVMASSKGSWSGTLVLIGQPAEEIGAGAKAMLADKLYTRFPKPDVIIAVHDDARFGSGLVGARAGPAMTNSDAFRIRIFGKGGHGARPEMTIDPIVIASRTILALQTIVSREISPFDPSVITVGAIHGGTKNNIIPEEVEMLLTVRSFTDSVRAKLIKAIERVVKAEAVASGATREPSIERTVVANALSNDTELTRRVLAALARDLGSARVIDAGPEMVSEDFSEYQREGVPGLMLRVGAIAPAKLASARASGELLPGLHSAQFAPDIEPTLRTAILSEVITLRELMPPRK